MQNVEEIISYALERIQTDSEVIIEKKLVGQEFILQAFWDGQTLSTMPLVQDFKRLLDGDAGPNTGSMGSYSRPDHRLSFLRSLDLEKAKEIMIKSLRATQDDTGEYY